MLSITRKKGEAVIMVLPDGREIRMVVTQAKFGVTRIRVDAPDDVKIWREEIKP